MSSRPAAVGGPTVQPSSDVPQGTYSVSSETGAAQYSVPIFVPPGRSGMQPSLALTYSSQAPLKGGVAMGWSLPIPMIRVDTSQGRMAAVHYESSLAGAHAA